VSLLAYLSYLLALGVIAQWFAWRFKLPSILLLLVFGFGLSSFTGARIDDYLLGEEALLSLVGFFVAIILFEGGLTLKFSELREARASVVRLCSLAVVVAFVGTTIAARWTLGYHWQICALLGAILVVTGPTVVAPILRLVQPRRKVASIVKWEGIVVDPVGAILALVVFQVIQGGSFSESWDVVLLALLKTAVVGGGLGYGLSKIVEQLLKRHHIPDFLESVFFLALVAVSFAGSNALQPESGLLTVTVLGVMLANQKAVSMRHILEFKENLRVLIISLLFLILSGRIGLEALQEVWLKGVLFLLLLILVVRPLSVFLANLGSSKTSFKEQLFLSLLAPRGIVAAAVTSVFALELEHLAHSHHGNEHFQEIAEQASQLVPLVFIVILGTVAFYGLLAAPLARRLELSHKNPDGILFAGADPWVCKIAKALQEDGHAVMLLDTRYQKISSARLDGLNAVRANILSEYAEEELDFSGLGHLVAATPNDEVNSLATKEFSHRFGKANVWQIKPVNNDDHHSKTVANHMRGRICFLGGPHYVDLSQAVGRGAVVKKTQLTDVFTLEDFHRTHGEDAIILFEHLPEKGLRPVESQEDIRGPGTIYSLITESSKTS